MDGRTDRRTDGRTDERTDRPTDGPTDKASYSCVSATKEGNVHHYIFLSRGTYEAEEDSSKVFEVDFSSVFRIIDEKLTDDFVVTNVEIQMHFPTPSTHVLQTGRGSLFRRVIGTETSLTVYS